MTNVSVYYSDLCITLRIVFHLYKSQQPVEPLIDAINYASIREIWQETRIGAVKHHVNVLRGFGVSVRRNFQLSFLIVPKIYLRHWLFFSPPRAL